jgi:hypothetical protein
MYCVTCQSSDNVVENQALGKTFYYCRGCKNEVGLKPKSKTCSGHIFDGFTDTCKFCGIGMAEYCDGIVSTGEIDWDKIQQDLWALLPPDTFLKTTYCLGGSKFVLCDCMICREAYE